MLLLANDLVGLQGIGGLAKAGKAWPESDAGPLSLHAHEESAAGTLHLLHTWLPADCC